jgi:hypothetical protein
MKKIFFLCAAMLVSTTAAQARSCIRPDPPCDMPKQFPVESRGEWCLAKSQYYGDNLHYQRSCESPADASEAFDYGDRITVQRNGVTYYRDNAKVDCAITYASGSWGFEGPFGVNFSCRTAGKPKAEMRFRHMTFGGDYLVLTNPDNNGFQRAKAVCGRWPGPPCEHKE